MNTPFRAETAPEKVRLRVEDFLLLDDAGAFDSYAKTELLDGEIWCMNAQHRPHARPKTRLAIALAEALSSFEGLEVLIEGSVSIPPHNVPEPDISVTDAAEGEGLMPGPSIRLAIEVADTTVSHDLNRKQRIYAAAGIPEYWVVDIPGIQVHQLWSPAPDGYRERRVTPLGARIESVTLAGLAIESAGLK